MRYLPHTDGDVSRMLAAIGLDSIDGLFASIPSNLRLNGELKLPPPLDENALQRLLTDLAGKDKPSLCFAGGGAYWHYIPAAIDHLLRRSEFYTSYTPYQPEISQGTLQAIFEFQTMVARLLGMEVVNASMYDGATATAEAVLMAMRATQRKKALVSHGLHPQFLKTLRTYSKWVDLELVQLPLDQSGQTDIAAMSQAVDDQTACVVVQSPNYLGVIENTPAIAKAFQTQKTRFIHVFTDALAFGLITPPGAAGAHIACGEGQALGIPLSFGGPYLGLFAVTKNDVRNMPGRVVGETVDAEGRRAFCLTLSTREQHIRREKATSNICTNEGLMALAATIYMALMGRQGMQKVARLNRAKAEYMKAELGKVATLPFAAPTFHEFVWIPKVPVQKVLHDLHREGIAAGIPLVGFAPELENAILTCVTEMISRKEIDRYVEIVRSM